MNIDEATKLKKDTENQIRALLEDLTEKTGLKVSANIDVTNYQAMGMPLKQIISVNIDLYL